MASEVSADSNEQGVFGSAWKVPGDEEGTPLWLSDERDVLESVWSIPGGEEEPLWEADEHDVPEPAWRGAVLRQPEKAFCPLPGADI